MVVVVALLVAALLLRWEMLIIRLMVRRKQIDVESRRVTLQPTPDARAMRSARWRYLSR